MSRPLLVTIGPSHYCEKARWALKRSGIEFDEEAHAPMLHWAFTLPRTGTRTAPILVTDDVKLTDSKDILVYCDRGLPEGRRLFPADPNTRREVFELSDRFDAELGPAVRRFAYSYLVDSPELFTRFATHRVPTTEALFVKAFGGVLRGLLRKAFRIRAGVSERMFEKVSALFSEVTERLADGRRYLVGDRFSAADLTFASLSMPCLRFGEEVSTSIPPALADHIRRLRETPAGAFAKRLDDEEKTPTVA